MKDDEKKTQRKDIHFSNEEDPESEILNAFERLERNRPRPRSSQDRSSMFHESIDLNSDNDDLSFGDEAPDVESSFSFDDSLREDLEQDLIHEANFDLDGSLKDDLVKEIQAAPGEDSFVLDLDKELSDSELDLDADEDFDMSSAPTLTFNFDKDDHPDDENDGLDLGSFSNNEDDFSELDLGIEGVEISEDFADLGQDISLDDHQDPVSGAEQISGKAVITVGDDEVIDLGDEEYLTQEQPVAVREQRHATPDGVTVEQIPSPPDIEDDDGELMASLEDIAIDLEQESNDVPVQNAGGPVVAEELSPETLQKRLGAHDDELPGSAEAESAEASSQESMDVRDFLGLDLRLNDKELREFEAKIREAETLQAYLNGLEEHRGEVSERIYEKLQKEYVARKTVIFNSEAFSALLTDVQDDLEHMLHKRAEIVEMVERLNEELEEIKVRNLVGEYDEATLSQKQRSQNSEIALWSEKTEKINAFINRYQASLDAEKSLNPLRDSADESSSEAALPEDAQSGLAPEPGAAQEGFWTEELAEETAGSLSEPTAETVSAHEYESARGPSPDDSFMTGGEELDNQFLMDEDLEEGDFALGDLPAFDDEEEETMIVCKLCGRQTAAAEKFCTYCGGKLQKAAHDTELSCKKCGRRTPADQTFCIYCGGKAQ
ncbi:hypothetical protein CSB45_03435 [candidate division KSB3 bacterium]|uniref:DZANK-type domain-containing protein n=1 Tax=candidate division KSB3 bacterium TaxID=2044937 RepID=A0A2G6E938_9BACT|nr:MAG: hypothetical protein CSB45_03435 [candidate division KSB3 bacterium]PIE29547.1 MAG: hypothetical protein CSA57_08030 [candidate division KSB3 bacterium]